MMRMAHPSSGRKDFSPTKLSAKQSSAAGGGGSTVVSHAGITCDQCGASPVVGVRYRCSVCPDFDLCDSCFRRPEEAAHGDGGAHTFNTLTGGASSEAPMKAAMYHPSSGRKDFDQLECSFSAGQKVEARFGGGRAYFYGTIIKPNGDGTYDIRYVDGDSEKAVEENLIRRREPMMRMAHPSSGRKDFSPTKLYAKPSSAAGGGGPAAVSHHGITCDQCGASPVVGVRYRCSVCPDFDLCEVCVGRPEEAAHGDGGAHLFLRLAGASAALQRHPQVANRSGVAHEGVWCDLCPGVATASPGRRGCIIGTRFQCVQCQVDLCEACEASGRHDPSHPRMKFAAAPRAKPPRGVGGTAVRGAGGAGQPAAAEEAMVENNGQTVGSLPPPDFFGHK
jgi:hypothetical protein